jgi:prepilin peptidase CpaA
MRPVGLLAVVGIALLWDLKRGKIPNGLILAGLILAGICSFEEDGIEGGVSFLTGSLAPILLLSILFFFRMLGAGDIKLFCVIGGFMGVKDLLVCMTLSFLVGAIVSLLLLIKGRMFFSRLSYFFCYISSFYRTGKRVPYRNQGTREGEFPFVIPIFISVLLYAGGAY